MAEQEQQDSFEIVTTAQVERTYIVVASDEDQAHKRLRTFLKDPDMLREGLVIEQPDKQADKTTQKVKAVKKIAKPRAVKDAAPAAAGAEG